MVQYINSKNKIGEQIVKASAEHRDVIEVPSQDILLGASQKYVATIKILFDIAALVSN